MAESEIFIYLQVLGFITWGSFAGHTISIFRHFINGLVGITGVYSEKKRTLGACLGT